MPSNLQEVVHHNAILCWKLNAMAMPLRSKYCFFHPRKRILLLVLALGFLANVQAQVGPASTTIASVATINAKRNSIRVDWGTVLAFNFTYNFWKDHGFVLPVLLSYERHLGSWWSVGGEVLINGGDPTQRRRGVSVFTRYYALPSGRHFPPLAGAYVSPVLHYRALRVTEGYWGNTPSVTRGHRLATGLLLGWQQPIGKDTGTRFVVDFAAGAYYQIRMGADQINDPYAYYSAFGDANNRESVRPGFRPDVRAGIGYQF